MFQDVLRRVAQYHLHENKSSMMLFYSLIKMSKFFNRFISSIIYKIVKIDGKKVKQLALVFFLDVYVTVWSLRLVPFFVGRACTQECLSGERRLPYIYCLHHPLRLLGVTTLYLILDRLRIRIIGVVKLAVNNIK